jgi:indolepyruvate ferredoxin oxidoreductase beta subunit
MEGKTIRIFFTGVGGQGTLFATRLVSEAALEENLPVLMSEIHGMAQRGGVVESSVVLGESCSPTIADGEADIVMAFEPLEAARALPKCNARTIVITNTTPILPFSVTSGQSTYPDRGDLYAMIEPHVGGLIKVDADGIAQSVHAVYSSNVVMIGVLAGTGILPISEVSWKMGLENIVPPPAIPVNLHAFESGYRIGAENNKWPR